LITNLKAVYLSYCLGLANYLHAFRTCESKVKKLANIFTAK
jgi:hypothetical protein